MILKEEWETDSTTSNIIAARGVEWWDKNICVKVVRGRELSFLLTHSAVVVDVVVMCEPWTGHKHKTHHKLTLYVSPVNKSCFAQHFIIFFTVLISIYFLYTSISSIGQNFQHFRQILNCIDFSLVDILCRFPHQLHGWLKQSLQLPTHLKFLRHTGVDFINCQHLLRLVEYTLKLLDELLPFDLLEVIFRQELGSAKLQMLIENLLDFQHRLFSVLAESLIFIATLLRQDEMANGDLQSPVRYDDKKWINRKLLFYRFLPSADFCCSSFHEWEDDWWGNWKFSSEFTSLSLARSENMQTNKSTYCSLAFSLRYRSICLAAFFRRFEMLAILRFSVDLRANMLARSALPSLLVVEICWRWKDSLDIIVFLENLTLFHFILLLLWFWVKWPLF